jgi:hypothetical protein
VDGINGRNAMAETDISRFDSRHGDVSDNMIGQGGELGKELKKARGRRAEYAGRGFQGNLPFVFIVQCQTHFLFALDLGNI